MGQLRIFRSLRALLWTVFPAVVLISITSLEATATTLCHVLSVVSLIESKRIAEELRRGHFRGPVMALNPDAREDRQNGFRIELSGDRNTAIVRFSNSSGRYQYSTQVARVYEQFLARHGMPVSASVFHDQGSEVLDELRGLLSEQPFARHLLRSFERTIGQAREPIQIAWAIPGRDLRSLSPFLDFEDLSGVFSSEEFADLVNLFSIGLALGDPDMNPGNFIRTSLDHVRHVVRIDTGDPKLVALSGDRIALRGQPPTRVPVLSEDQSISFLFGREDIPASRLHELEFLLFQRWGMAFRTGMSPHVQALLSVLSEDPRETLAEFSLLFPNQQRFARWRTMVQGRAAQILEWMYPSRR